ncbi:MAG: glycosyltransferase [Methylophilaceae bacterium]|nr:glycosyltransferase [Methylophilaceae bacterium]
MLHKSKHSIRASAVVLAYNQSNYISESIHSVLNQDFEGLEIILSDDGSTDDTFKIMSDIAHSYNGPHTIKLNKNINNLGFIGHLNKIFTLVSGEFIFYNPGDDISFPDRFAKIWAEYERTDALLVHSDVIKISDSGDKIGVWSRQSILENLTLETAARLTALCIGATCGWHRDIIGIFGKITEADTYDDVIFYFRAMLAGNRIGYVPEPLMYYRIGSGMTNTAPKTHSEKEAHFKKNSIVRLATMKQRLRDCELYDPKLHRVKRYLNFEIKIYKGLVLAHHHRSYFSIIKNFSPTVFLGYITGKRDLKGAYQWPLALARLLQELNFLKIAQKIYRKIFFV